MRVLARERSDASAAMMCSNDAGEEREAAESAGVKQPQSTVSRRAT